MKEAMYWEKLEGDKVQCKLCPHFCKMKPGKMGKCRNKINEGGTLMAVHYNEITALAMDPIEKKPLYHFFPGSMILSVGTQGCNFACDFCQNWHLWDGDVHHDEATPEEVVNSADKHQSKGIAYTYNEPYMSYEYVIECAKLAKERGLYNVMVTNGFYNPEPANELLPYIDAMNIDLKALKDDFYKKLCKGSLDPVLNTIERANKECLVELTNLIVTDENDSDEDLESLVDWIAGVSPDIPIHFSAYRPMYKMSNPPTPRERLEKAYEIAGEKLNYVYVGNVIIDIGQDSICPHCKEVLVERSGFSTKIHTLSGNKCSSCNNEVNFVN